MVNWKRAVCPSIDENGNLLGLPMPGLRNIECDRFLNEVPELGYLIVELIRDGLSSVKRLLRQGEYFTK
jgi:hypothetical protein